MGFLDRLKRSGAIDKAVDAIADNADKVDDGIDKAAAAVDAKTKGKHRGTIDKVAGAAKKGVDQAEAQAQKQKTGRRSAR